MPRVVERCADDVFQLSGHLLEGRYAVHGVVARGGSGVVYKATRLDLGVPVALKVLHIPPRLRGASEDALVERFRVEARILAGLRHHAIVRVYELGALAHAVAPNGGVWMALEWLDGVTLDRDLAARDGLGRSPRAVLALLAPVFDALACVHAQGIAHRDVKPANLMLAATARGDIDLRVLDFGIAKVMLPDECAGTGVTDTRSDHASFSLSYSAPEQVARARTGPWTDVHALGLLVIELLLGTRAYASTDSFSLYGEVMSPARPTTARGGRDLGPWEPVLRKALALQPGDRYAAAGAMHEALAATVDDAEARWARRPTLDAAQHGGTTGGFEARRRGPSARIVAALAIVALVPMGWRVPRAPERLAMPRASVAPSNADAAVADGRGPVEPAAPAAHGLATGAASMERAGVVLPSASRAARSRRRRNAPPRGATTAPRSTPSVEVVEPDIEID